MRILGRDRPTDVRSPSCNRSRVLPSPTTWRGDTGASQNLKRREGGPTPFTISNPADFSPPDTISPSKGTEVGAPDANAAPTDGTASARRDDCSSLYRLRPSRIAAKGCGRPVPTGRRSPHHSFSSASSSLSSLFSHTAMVCALRAPDSRALSCARPCPLHPLPARPAPASGCMAGWAARRHPCVVFRRKRLGSPFGLEGPLPQELAPPAYVSCKPRTIGRTHDMTEKLSSNGYNFSLHHLLLHPSIQARSKGRGTF